MNILTNFEEALMSTMEISIPSQVTNVTKIEPIVRNIFDNLCCNEDHYGTVLIAVTEAVNNAIVHGNAEDENKQVHISIVCNEGKIFFSVQDEGEGFDHNSIPDPTSPENLEKIRGRGVFLMKKLCDEIEFENEGRKVKMMFNVS